MQRGLLFGGRCLAFLFCISTLTAFAQKGGDQGRRDEEAKALFQAGRLAFEDGRFEDALRNFDRAYELSKRPTLLYNIGAASDRLRQNEKALSAFRSYLESVPNASNRREVEGRVRYLEGVVAQEKAAAERLESERAKAAADAKAQAEEQAKHQLDAESQRRAAAEAAAAQATAERDAAKLKAENGGQVEEGSSNWWVWLLVGAAVVGAGIGAFLIIQNAQDPGFVGDSDVQVRTLSRF